jgi:hypothetical protein
MCWKGNEPLPTRIFTLRKPRPEGRSLKPFDKILFDVSKEELLGYFKARMPHYKSYAKKNDYLLGVLKKIEDDTILSSSTHSKLKPVPTQAPEQDVRDTLWLKFFNLPENKAERASGHKEILCNQHKGKTL